MKRIFLIDGNSLANRAFYALPFLTNLKGEPSGAVYGFANLLIKLIVDEKPDDIIVAFDHARKTFRNEIYEEYKGTRKPTPPELISQFPIIKEMLKKMEITTIESAGIEADDIIGTLARDIKDAKKIIVSGDRDLLQLIDDDTEVWLTRKGLTDLQKLTNKNMSTEMGFYPKQTIDMKALMGDSSDNIPGVPGIGEKTALKLIDMYVTLENLYKNIDEISGKLREKLIEGKDLAFMSKDLATIRTDCKIKYVLDGQKFPFSQEVYQFFIDWNFSSLLGRKDLFVDGVKDANKHKNINKIKIKNIEDVRELKNKIKGWLGYSLLKLEFAAQNDEIYYLDSVISMFAETLSLEEVLYELKDVFEDKKVLKITQSAKSDMHKLNSLDINLNNFFDIEISNYLLSAGIKVNNGEVELSDYYREYLNQKEKIEEKGLNNILYNCEFPLVEVLFNMEKNGFQIDEKKLCELDEEYSNAIALLQKEIYSLAGEPFNINSPKQVSEIIFNKLGLKSFNNKKQSTGSEYLLEMVDQHPIVASILSYRKLNKLQTTYITVYKKICENNGNIIHTVFNQTLTSTGRLSSSEPNLQNIPTRDDIGKNIRKLFISKFKGGKIISADYNQIELRLLADMSGEKELIEAYERGDDIHSLTASQIFNVPIENVTPAQRRDAKAVNFGIIYGISDYGLAQNIKTSRKRAKDYIDSYFMRYPKIKEFSDNNIEFARKNGFIKTAFGRIRNIPEINASNFNVRSFAERVAMNMPLQGTASDVIKFAMIKVFEEMSGLKSQLILQIHDELIVDVYPGEEDKIKKILRDCMEDIYKNKVKLVVSINEGKSLFDCK